MNTKTIIAVALVVLGIVVLAYSGITFTTPGKPVEFLGLHLQTTDSHFIPPIVGALALLGGIVLFLIKPQAGLNLDQKMHPDIDLLHRCLTRASRPCTQRSR